MSANLQRGEAEEEGDHDAQARVQVAGGDGKDEERQERVDDDGNDGLRACGGRRVSTRGGVAVRAWMDAARTHDDDKVRPDAIDAAGRYVGGTAVSAPAIPRARAAARAHPPPGAHARDDDVEPLVPQLGVVGLHRRAIGVDGPGVIGRRHRGACGCRQVV